MPLSTSESWYLREEVPPALDAFGDRLCAHYRVPAVNFGAKGNELHLRGRHRSIEWCLESTFCTDRSYGTRDVRDTSGNHRHIRAFDFEFPTPAEFHAACHRLDDAVRAGLLPELAEWFGTFDGMTVVGWFEGHASSSDGSHRYHLHTGVWTKYADDAAFYGRLFNIITGQGSDVMALLVTKDETGALWVSDGMTRRPLPTAGLQGFVNAFGASIVNKRVAGGPAGLSIGDPGLDDAFGLLPTAVEPAPVDVSALAAALSPLLEAAAEAAVRKVLGAVDGATPPTA